MLSGDRSIRGGGSGGTVPRNNLGLYSPSDILAHFWRQRALLALIFLIIVGIGAAVAFSLKSTYQARSSLLVRLGQEYVYQPGVGDAGRGTAADNDQIVQSELEILSSASLKLKVIRDIGFTRLFPTQSSAWAVAGSAERRKLEGNGVKEIETGLKIATAPDTSVVRLTYSGKDPEMAALVLNTLLDEYLIYRRTVLAGGDVQAVSDQRLQIEARLKAADMAYNQFLADNHIGDFETEKASVAASYGQLVAESYTVQAQLGEATGNLSVTARLAQSSPAEVGLYRDIDHTASDRLNQLKLERQEMMARYQPGAQPLRDKDAQIAALESLLASTAPSAGAQRVGLNPIWQTLITERNQLEGRAASLRSRRAAIVRDLADLTMRRQKLAALEPQAQALQRDRDILASNAKALGAREQEIEAQQALSRKGADNIRVVERAFVPSRGTSIKAPVMAVFILAAGFTSLMAGFATLLFDRKGYSGREAVERGLGVDVLGAVPVR